MNQIVADRRLAAFLHSRCGLLFRKLVATAVHQLPPVATHGDDLLDERSHRVPVRVHLQPRRKPSLCYEEERKEEEEEEA